VNYRLTACFSPDEKYTRHSEGAFLRLKDGTILFAYSRFTGLWNDDAPSDIVAVTSHDEGETWSEARTLVPASHHGASNIMSVSLMRMGNGDVGLFYIVKKTPLINQIILARSNDESQTFYQYTDCTARIAQGYYVLNNDRVIRLDTGRLVMPLAFHRGGLCSWGEVTLNTFDGRGIAVCLLSDDDGNTWREARDVVFPPFTGTDTGLQEPGAIQLQNGTVWAWYRTDQGVQYQAFSLDRGEHWTVAQPSRFTSPASPLKIARHPDGRLFAVWNPIPAYNGRKLRFGLDRTPLVWAVSKDDGATWSDCNIIENDTTGQYGYCYPAIFFTDDGYMMCAYCAGSLAEGGCLNRLTIHKIAI